MFEKSLKLAFDGLHTSNCALLIAFVNQIKAGSQPRYSFAPTSLKFKSPNLIMYLVSLLTGNSGWGGRQHLTRFRSLPRLGHTAGLRSLFLFLPTPKLTLLGSHFQLKRPKDIHAQ
jgi:hypothetical protein